MTTQRPYRQRKSDRLISPGATKEEIMVDHAVAVFDREATRMERKWGYDRLPELVPADLAMRYGGAVAFLNKAIEDCDPAAAAAASENCVKGLRAMDAAATNAGHQPPAAIAHGEVDGWAFRIVADAADQSALPDDGIPTFTLRAVGNALKAYLDSPLVAATQAAFPLADVKRIKPKDPVDWNRGDELPF